MTNGKARDRWQYRVADDMLAGFEQYLDRFESDNRPHIPMLVEWARESIGKIRYYMGDAPDLVAVARRASRPMEHYEHDLAALTASNAEPELAILEFQSLHRALFLLEIADALPPDELDKLSEQAADSDTALEGVRLGVLEKAGGHDRLALLFRIALARQRQTTDFAAERNRERSEEAGTQHERWLAEDAKLKKESPHLTSKRARAQAIRRRLNETITADHIARKLPAR